MKVSPAALLVVCCISLVAFIGNADHFAHSKAGYAGQILTMWLILSALIYVILYVVHRFDQHLERQEFWEEMQEYMDGTHPSQTEEP